MSQRKICGVYKITHIASGKSYIGISKDINRRWAEHKVSKSKNNGGIHEAMEKHGIDAFSWQIIEQCNVSLLQDREAHWIAVFDTYRNGYNLTSGGQYNKEISYESRKKMSNRKKGTKLSSETLKKLIGRKQSQESIEKSRLSRTGIKFSEESKKKMSAAHLGKKLSPETKKKISEKTKEALMNKKLAEIQFVQTIQ